MGAVGLALGASLAWGLSDFLGGLAARRLPVLAVLLASQAVGLVLVAAVWAATDPVLPGGRVALVAAGAGVAEVVGFACLYRALAVGSMSVIAPLGALTAVLPVVVALAGGAGLSTAEAAGVALAIGGTALAAVEPGGRRVARGAGLAVAAALAFGAFLVGLGASGEAAGSGAVLVGRVASVAVLAAVVVVARPGREALALERDGLGAVAALGALDAVANLAFAGAAATRGGDGVVVAVIGSLYPAATVVLARVVLAERLGRLRATGVGAVLGGVALLSAASA